MPAQEPAVLPGNADLGPKAPKPWAMEEADLPAPARRIGSPNAMNRARGALPMWWRLKPLQLNEGRVEISVSYHVAIAVALVVILVILAGFRLGQRHSGAKAEAGTETKAPARAAPENTATGAGGAASPASGSAQPGGDNWIVLATHGNSADLEPVKEHFAKNGIALEICAVDVLRQWLSQNGLTAAGLPNGDGLFLLVTSGAYHNPQNPDTDGYRMKQKIASVGATYKAPKGRDPFTPRLFSDAYGMKISRMK